MFSKAEFLICYLAVICYSLDFVTCRSHREKMKSAQRIVSGARVKHASYPFLVSIQALNRHSNTWMHGCGGSIVAKKVILTACHCVGLIVGNHVTYGFADNMRIVAGTDSWKRPSTTMQIRNASKVVAHPKCSNNPDEPNGLYNNDVAVIFLKEPLKYGKGVEPLKLYSHHVRPSVDLLNLMIENGQSCYVAGWGTTEEFVQKSSEGLMASKVILITPSTCRLIFCLLDNQHCEIKFEKIGQVCGVSQHSSDCQGDSGGPLVCNGMVFGIVSYGDRCTPTWPSVFQGVGPIIEFLNYMTGHTSWNDKELFKQDEEKETKKTKTEQKLGRTQESLQLKQYK